MNILNPNKIVPYGKQTISRRDIKAVVKVLRSEFLTQGPIIFQFEAEVAKYCGAKFGISTNSATSALHIALLSLGVKPGDQVWTSPNSFVASANSALYCAAKIDFVDINPITYNMCPIKLEQKLEKSKKLGTLPKAVIAVHFAGQSCEMDKISALSKMYGFHLIEDASHAFGGTYKSKPIGGCQFSDITIFSFHPVKIITTGEGGIAMTNDPKLAEQMRLLRSHGIVREKEIISRNNSAEIWAYRQVLLGFNYRLTDFQAALGLSQLKNLNKYVAKRRRIAHVYDTKLSSPNTIIPWQHKDTNSSYHLYVIRVKNPNKLINQLSLFTKLQQNKIAPNIHYIPIHLQPYFKNLGFKRGDFPESEKYFRETISLPIYPNLKRYEQNKVIQVIQEFIN